MMNGLLHAHSGLRWIVLVLLVMLVAKAWQKGKADVPYTEQDRKLNLYTLIATHLQLLLGLALYFMSDKVNFDTSSWSVTVTRFFTVEHSLMMLLAIALITLGYVKAKKATSDTDKFRTVFRYNAIALLLILIAIPWPFRGFGSGWF